MKILNFLFNIYINSSLHVALAVCSLVGITYLEFDVNVSYNLLGFIFFGTIVGYNFVKFAAIYKKRFMDMYLHLKVVQIFSVLALFYFSIQLTGIVLVVFGGFALLTFLYAIPLLKYKNLRKITGLKITIVAIVWAGVTVLIPLINENVMLDMDSWITFFQRFLFVFVLTLPFEIRDLQFDDLTLETLPQRVGVKKTKIIGILLLVIMMLIELFKDSINLYYLISMFVVTVVLILFLWNSEKKQSNYFSSFWVESIPILWLGILSFFQFYFDIS